MTTVSGPSRVVDGDTVVVGVGGGQVRIRLRGVRRPEES
jgi:endonuclease YncB( thermonuclease family)